MKKIRHFISKVLPKILHTIVYLFPQPYVPNLSNKIDNDKVSGYKNGYIYSMK